MSNNNGFFHKVVGRKQQRNRIDVICDENGQSFEWDDVGTQFLGEEDVVENIVDAENLVTINICTEEANC
jgi:hypothetical protein